MQNTSPEGKWLLTDMGREVFTNLLFRVAYLEEAHRVLMQEGKIQNARLSRIEQPVLNDRTTL